MSAKDALLSFSKKQIQKNNRQKRRKNKKPEQEMVDSILKWCRKQGMNLDVIEASGGMNKFGSITVKSGYSDISGNDKHGFAVYIEAKASGKRSTLKGHQYEFLKGKIESNAFAMVIDNVEHLASYYFTWLMHKENGQSERAKKYLLDNLFVPKVCREETSDDLPW